MALSTGAVVVFALIAVAVGLFVTELLPPDMTAVAVLVALAVLEPFTNVPASDAIAGFASPAVVTIIAMYILSRGVQTAGVVDWLGAHLARLTRGSDRRLLGATTGATGLFAGLVNNTPVVAVFIPMVTDLADDSGVSPSKFLMPLSFAAMLGGTLTLVGSSINLLASDVAASTLGRSIGMFEFTPLGLLVFAVGLVYLLTVGYRLTPPRRDPAADVTAAYDLERNLAQVRVREASPLVGRTATDLFLDADLELDLDVLQIERERTVVAEGDDATVEGLQTRTVTDTYIAGSGQPIAAGDLLTVRANPQVLNRFAETYDLRQLPRERVDAQRLEAETHPGMLVEVVVPEGSGLVDSTPEAERLTRSFETKVLAIRRGDDLVTADLADRTFRTGDTLLLQTTESALAYLREEGDIVPLELPGEGADGPPTPPALGYRAPLSTGILVAAVLLAAVTPLAIPVTALGGVVALVATGCLSTSDAYDAVSWNVVFLLAGILPLGVALQRTGGAAVVGDALGSVAGGLAPTLVLGVVYLLAALLAAVITPFATIVLLGPVAVDTAATIGADGFSFVLATLFGASAAYITPIGYQTNLMVYGPGGYRFTDYLRVGLPLLAVLAVVSTLGIRVLYGV
mgnify:CR=1 FL=1